MYAATPLRQQHQAENLFEPMKIKHFTRWIAVFFAAGLPLASEAGIYTFDAILDGSSEAPPNASPGTGFAQVTFDTILNTMEVNMTFSGLMGTTTASHIHAATASPGIGTAGVATTSPTFPGFPLGVTSGTYDHVFDMTQASSYNSVFLADNGGTPATAEFSLLAAMVSGEAYLNIHTTAVASGEIRGFLTVVPEPGACALLVLGLAAPAILRFRNKRLPNKTAAGVMGPSRSGR